MLSTGQYRLNYIVTRYWAGHIRWTFGQFHCGNLISSIDGLVLGNRHINQFVSSVLLVNCLGESVLHLIAETYCMIGLLFSE